MSRRNKLEKFADNLTYKHVYESFEFGDPVLTRTEIEKVKMAGLWHKLQFCNSHPILLELACGKGEYTLDLARRYPNKNFIGVDVKGARIWKGATIARTEKLSNVAFLRTRIEQIELFFAREEVSEIWITFPDPFPKEGKENRRLTSPPFLEKYQTLLKKGGVVHLKTDSDLLYKYSLKSVENFPNAQIYQSNSNIYAGELPNPDLDILTYYEKQHLEDGRTIKYLKFGFDAPGQ
ncbi:MAG: tRNA (guanosine(46)-N7)-methyltransferase TrmB [Saprospirales bacterium]|nr:MAG: tRNA (guanosine(46)-N7)-methyltransferase TrmB [Saprospirales bacterium]